ncbi:MAG: DUF3347 domain-containing protein [Candidatus Dadabacteria bacterium]
MKKLFPIALILLLAACNSYPVANENDEVNDTSSVKQQWNKYTIANKLTIKDGQLNAIYDHYSKLTKALVAADIHLAKIESNAIEAGSQGLPGASALANFAARITSASTIAQQRSAYSKLSSQLIILLKKSAVSKGSLYVDFCPMAFNDEGAYWVSEAKEINNPYLGTDMLTCGEIKETLSNN